MADRVDLALAQRLADEATPGPWHWVDSDTDQPVALPATEYVRMSLRTVKQYPAHHKMLGTLPRFIIYEAETDGSDNAADALFIAWCGSNVSSLVAELVGLREATDRVRQLHQIEHRYQSSRDDDWSVDTPEEAADIGECDLAEVVFFDVCAHCASTETHEGSYDGSYLYSLWPCPTVAILDGDPK